MRGYLCAIGLVAIGGCMSTGTVGDDDSGDPNACTHSLTLDGASGSSEPTAVGPVALGSTNICMHLDASHNLVRGHFMASTDVEPGAASSFTTTLTEIDGTMIVEGWDVTFGQSDPQSRATLEWSIPSGEVHDVILHVTARAGDAATTIRLALFEPFE